MYIVALEEEALQRRLTGRYAAHSDGEPSRYAGTWHLPAHSGGDLMGLGLRLRPLLCTRRTQREGAFGRKGCRDWRLLVMFPLFPS